MKDAEIGNLKATLAGEIQRHKYRIAQCEKLEAKLKELEWRPITETDMPKNGDELFGQRGSKMMWMPENYAPIIPMAEDFTFAGWTHFRPINAPKGEQP